MSFTSTISVRSCTVLVYVVNFFHFFLSMEKILQNIVKIIIIGILLATTSVNCNRQFPPPSIPYFQNQDYFIPGFVPPYADRVPVYYQEQNVHPPPPPPPPISYQNLNSYSAPQLFHQNENYNPTQFTNPTVSYSVPQVFPFKPNVYRTFESPEKLKFNFQQNNYKKPITLHAESHSDVPQKKPAFYATNIIVKEESHSPYYQDEYSNHDEDYTDNYSDENSSPPDPCVLNSPYRYFESPKPDLTNPNMDNKLVICNPHFQPNFGNSVYTVKMPITLLPSRFPPRVEEFIERIQNYFSTYTQQETPKPQNQTLSTTTLQPVTEVSSESEEQFIPTTEDSNKKNITLENQEVNFEQTNSEPSEQSTVSEVKDVTERTVFVPMETKEEEISSTAAPDAQVKNEEQMVVQTTPTSEQAEFSPVTTERVTSHQDFHTEHFPAVEVTQTVSFLPSESVTEPNNITDNLVLNTQMTNLKNEGSETDSTEMRKKIEETSTIHPANEKELQLQVKDNNG